MSAQNQSSSHARRPHELLLCGIVAVLSVLPAAGQLAITEVQSVQSSTPVLRGTDYWELTNFGASPVDLSDYWFTDEGGFSRFSAKNLALLAPTSQIAGHESMIFANERIDVLTTPDEFRQWWGESNLRSDLTIVVAPWAFGFSAFRDAVQLWRATRSETNLVDRVELFESDPGATFTYDPDTGLLDRISVENVDEAFRAATTTDVGSPGRTIGPVPLRVVEAPVGVVADGGSPVTLTVRAVGLPRPHYQWLFNGQPVSGATGPTLAIANVGSEDAGQYSVEVSNGLTNLLTPPATLYVNLTPSCARIVRPPEDIAVLPHQTACFTVEVRGYPLPDIQWQFNGQDIPGATNTTYMFSDADASRVGRYTVDVTNALCATNASAWLDVVPPPKLTITEAMAWPSGNTAVAGHDDWWELTNHDTNAVNLRGYRFDDSSRTLTNAVVVTNDVVVQPGCSVIWVSSMTPEAFKHWWGEENLPEDLQIISYPGNGFDISGDVIRLWNATARADEEFLISFGVLDQSDTPTEGVSLECEEDFGDCGVPSVDGERGAFRAAESDDIGSPGWTNNEQRADPRPQYLSIRREASGISLRWKTKPGRTYIVQHCSDLANPNWTPLLSLPAVGSWLSTADTVGDRQRFYRVQLQPLTP
jgi:hypothetical protein